jgi:hypothetical protein
LGNLHLICAGRKCIRQASRPCDLLAISKKPWWRWRIIGTPHLCSPHGRVPHGAKQIVLRRIELVDSFRNQLSRGCKCNFPLVQEARLNGRTMKNS